MRRERVSWRYEVDLSPAQERRILLYIAEELTFYNEMNQRMNQLIRQIPEGFIEAAANLRVFGELIELFELLSDSDSSTKGVINCSLLFDIVYEFKYYNVNKIKKKNFQFYF